MSGTLTPLEILAVHQAGELANTLSKIVGDGLTADADIAELVHHVHVIQRTVMSQAAARAHPDQFRLLGEVGDWEPV